ncbi:MAG: aminopeptidase P family protein [Ignavibacteria bacterium]|nr:aminopeptidase P family protein [Ignavibacteria bacterium]
MNRIEQTKNQFNLIKIDSFLVTNLSNIRYLSGFSGSAGTLLLTKGMNYFVTDFRYKSQSKDEVNRDFKVIIYTQNSFNYLSSLIKKHKLKRIGFESHILNVNEFITLKKKFPQVNFIPVDSFIESIVVKKTDKEIATLKKAVDITDNTFTKILNKIKPGVTEKALSAEITYIQKKLGAEKDAFDPIVASGERSAYPHAKPTDKKIQNGDLLTLDFGCVFDGMHSDMTRTVAIGNLSSEKKKIYSIVKEAQQRALEFVKAGIIAKKLDSCARGYIKGKGFGKNFGHGLGHGLGYDIHEGPRIFQKNNYRLEENIVITIEPGIYVEGLGGVRIEDDIVVKDNGCEILNKSTKELIVL